MDSAGRPVVVLSGRGGLRVARFRKNGSPDRSFGLDGETFVGSWSTLNSQLAWDHGDLVVSGRDLVGCPTCEYQQLVQIAHLLPNGTPDPDFGVDGVATRVLPPGLRAEGPILVPPNGSMVAAGSTYPEGLDIVRFDAEGGFDDSFGPHIDSAFTGFPGLKPSFSAGLFSRPG